MIWKCSRNGIHWGIFTLPLFLGACFVLMRTDSRAQEAAVVVSEFVFDLLCHIRFPVRQKLCFPVDTAAWGGMLLIPNGQRARIEHFEVLF